MHKPELLSPAGSMESLRAAVRYGADAVYFGGPKLQMRASSAGFTMEKAAEAVDFLHAAGKKAYITVNTVLSEAQLSELPQYIGLLGELAPDGLIAADLGAVVKIHALLKNMPIILSTQANVMNSAAANAYHDLGVTKIVLAREMPLEDIALLRKNIRPELELEAFVHGSMCMAYSGRCLLSSFLLDRSANRGECAQSCRWEYRLEERKRPGQFFPIEEADRFSMILSSRDLCMIEHLDALAEAGVVSFKIEGRMKTEYYTAAVTNAYRMALDAAAPLPVCRAELDKVSHRPYTTGFYYKELPDAHFNSGLYEQDWSFAGTVLSYENGLVTLRQRNKISAGDTLDVLSPGRAAQTFRAEYLLNEADEKIESAPHPLMTVKLPCPFPVAPGDMLRKPVTEH